MNRFIYHYKQVKGIVFFTVLSIKRKIRVAIGKQVYYVIGDSHALCFQHEYFEIHHIGPATAYKLNFEKSTTKSKEKVIKIIDKIYRNKPINIIFVFGELDVRIHINKIANEKNLSVNKVINNTIKAYMSFLNFIKSRYPLVSIYVFNVLPQGEEKNRYKYPFYADRKKRLQIAVRMNERLKRHSSKNNFRFIQVYEKLIDNKGDRIKKFMFDDVHFNRKIMPFVVNALENIKNK